MVFWIINSLLWAFWDVAYKKSLAESEWKISSKYYQFVWYILSYIILIAWLIFFDLGKINFTIFILLTISATLSLFSELFEVYSYKNEKISVLLPYWQFKSIFAIIIWYFIFDNNSLNSFIFAALAWITLIIWAIEFKEIKFNKYCLSMLFSSFLSWLRYILYWFLLIEISEFTIIFYTTILLILSLFIYLFLKKEISEYKKINKKLWLLILLENSIRIVVLFITLLLIKELWVVQAVLIWMLYIITTLIFSYIMLKDKPKNKDIIVITLVTIFIWLWTYLW